MKAIRLTRAYIKSVIVFARRGGFLALLIVAGWLLMPVIYQTLLHPSDAVGLHYFIDGMRQPSAYSTRGRVVGFLITLFLAGVLLGSQFLLRLLLCRKTHVPLRLSPFAAILVAIAGNAGWWIGTGYYDQYGAFAGAVPAVLMFFLDLWVERAATDFVYGPGAAPNVDEVYDFTETFTGDD